MRSLDSSRRNSTYGYRKPWSSRTPDHEPWLESRKHQITFSYWNRYRTYLQKRLKPGAIESLDETTDQILGLMEDPQRAGLWSTYGLVYGQVQSGKTANYTGVICKAIDAGYRVVVVLTSQHESLRHQTQERLDREFLGFNSKFTRSSDADSSMIIGVGALGLKSPDIICQAITTRDKDFTAGQLQGTPVNIHEVRILVVAKKNKRILENLKDWLGSSAARRHHPETFLCCSSTTRQITPPSTPGGRRTAKARAIRIMTPPPSTRPSVTCSACSTSGPTSRTRPRRSRTSSSRTPPTTLSTGRTCSPEFHGRPGAALQLLRPGGRVRPEDPDADEIREPLPIISPVEDHQAWIPDGHRKGYQPAGSLPPSLVEAIDAFVISTAVRRARQRDHGVAAGHSTMLVHVTRWTDVQGIVARQIEEHLRSMADAWGDHGTSGRELRERLRAFWDRRL